MKGRPIFQVLECQGLVQFEDVILIIGAPVPLPCHPILLYVVSGLAGTMVEPTVAYTFYLAPQFSAVSGVLGISMSEAC